jgi:hypothetical protein
LPLIVAVTTDAFTFIRPSHFFANASTRPPRNALVERIGDQVIALNRRPDAGGSLSGYLVDKRLEFPDGRIVDWPDCFTTALTFDGASKAHGFVTDVEFDPANRAFRLGPDIVKFVRHDGIIADHVAPAKCRTTR